jgi:hypothetical protein
MRPTVDINLLGDANVAALLPAPLWNEHNRRSSFLCA